MLASTSFVYNKKYTIYLTSFVISLPQKKRRPYNIQQHALDLMALWKMFSKICGQCGLFRSFLNFRNMKCQCLCFLFVCLYVFNICLCVNTSVELRAVNISLI